MGQAASEGWVSFPAERRGPTSRDVARRGLSWIGGLLATTAAVLLAAVLTVVFAATMAVMFVLTSALVGLYALTHRRPRGMVIQARKVGHSWVAYSWDQRPR